MFFMWWRGWGVVVVGIVIVAFALATVTVYQFKIYAQLFTVLGIYLALAGVATWYVGKRMNRHAERTLVDPATGEQVILRDHHSLFSIRVEWWGPILVVVGVLSVVTGVLDTGTVR